MKNCKRLFFRKLQKELGNIKNMKNQLIQLLFDGA